MFKWFILIVLALPLSTVVADTVYLIGHPTTQVFRSRALEPKEAWNLPYLSAVRRSPKGGFQAGGERYAAVRVPGGQIGYVLATMTSSRNRPPFVPNEHRGKDRLDFPIDKAKFATLSAKALSDQKLIDTHHYFLNEPIYLSVISNCDDGSGRFVHLLYQSNHFLGYFAVVTFKLNVSSGADYPAFGWSRTTPKERYQNTKHPRESADCG